MPARIATVKKKLSANGQALHRAMMSRAGAADAKPSEAEAALLEERRALKEEREKRKAQALLPRPSALDRLVRTHHPEGKHKPKAPKEAKAADAKGAKAKAAKPHATRSEKQAAKASALDAARRAKKKSDKT